MRAIFAVLMCLVSGHALAQDAACMTKEKVIAFLEGSRPGIKHVIYTGIDSDAIKTNISKNGQRLDGPREFVVFSAPTTDNKLVVGFKDGCYEGQQVVPPDMLDRWLAGMESTG